MEETIESYGSCYDSFARHVNGDRPVTNGGIHNTVESCPSEPSMPIAIIGMSCRFPGDVTSPEKLWELCASARSTWTPIPLDRFDQKGLYHEVKERSGTSNVTGGHFMTGDLYEFDASFFNLSAEVAATMDPQLRLQLESAFEALENAGLPLEKVAGSDMSVIAGAFHRDHHDSLSRDPDNLPRYFMTGNGLAMFSNRLSHFFDLRGTSFTADTGCSTSHTILHMACRGLQAGDSQLAMISAGNTMLNPDAFNSMSGLGLLSADGRSYAFDARANGYGRGEGVATLILKPLDNALRDGDPVRAVIRSTLLNQDGRTPTITSPNGDAQEELIRRCYRNADLELSDTTYVECHGTGTQAGDPTETAALARAFQPNSSPERNLYIGSVKSNIGHLEAVSGIAGIIKTVMAFENEQIPPNHDLRDVNPKILLNEWNLKVCIVCHI